MEKLKFELTLDESNQVLKSLGEMPYAQVVNLIAKIKQQAELQLQQRVPLEQAEEEPPKRKSKMNGKREVMTAN